jgi:hypothetical protein
LYHLTGTPKTNRRVDLFIRLRAARHRVEISNTASTRLHARQAARLTATLTGNLFGKISVVA